MIKILKHGIKPEDVEYFIVCNNCTCEFVCTGNEIKHQFSQREVCSWDEIVCPCCGKMVHSNENETFPKYQTVKHLKAQNNVTSPCYDCSKMNKTLCSGCKKYFEWEEDFLKQ